MYLRKSFILVALFIGLLFQIRVTEGALQLGGENGFYFFYDQVLNIAIDKGKPIPSDLLARYAARAYRDMIAPRSNFRATDYPEAMTALWLPDTQEIILASSAKGKAGFAYHPGNIPMELQVELEAAAVVGTSEKRWATDRHNKGGACGEIVAMSLFYSLHPGKDRIGQPSAKFVTVTQNGIADRNAPITVANACEGTDSGPGCRDFLSELGLSWCQRREVPGPLRKRQGLSLVNVLGKRQNDQEDHLDLTSFTFECHPGMPLPNDAPIATTVSPEIETSVSLETVTATAMPVLVPDSGVQVDISGGSAIDNDGNVVTTLVPLVSPIPSPGSQNPQIAPGSGNPGGNAPDNTPQNPADGSGTNSNPQDPYANSGPGSVNPPKLFIRSVGYWLGRVFR